MNKISNEVQETGSFNTVVLENQEGYIHVGLQYKICKLQLYPVSPKLYSYRYCCSNSTVLTVPTVECFYSTRTITYGTWVAEVHEPELPTSIEANDDNIVPTD
jgi:hypothetical protein